MNFVDTIICKSRTHCTACRSRCRGENWRRVMARNYPPPGEWNCPFGKDWIEDESDVIPAEESKPASKSSPEKDAKKPKKAPIWLQDRILACEGGEDREECPNWSFDLKQCRLLRICTPCYRKVTSNHCPMQKW